MSLEHLGYGLIVPFQRDTKNDFANAGGVEIVRSGMKQALGVRGRYGNSEGEVPWRTDQGSILPYLRHRNIDDMLKQQILYFIRDTLRRWEPRVLVEEVTVEQGMSSEQTTLHIDIRYSIIKTQVSGNEVYMGPYEDSIEVG